MYLKKSVCLKSSCVILICLLSLFKVNAANFTSSQSGDWDKGATWGNGSLNIIGVTYPGPLDNATVTSGKNVQVKQSQSVTNITINTGGVLTNSNNKDLTVFGNYVLNGIHTGGTGSKVTFFGISKSISGIGTMDLPGGATFTFSISILSGTNLNVAADLNLSAGVTVTNNGKITMISPAVITATASGPVWVNAANSFLSPGASTNVLNNVTLNASATGNTVNYYQTPVQNIKIPVSNTYYNLIISGVGTKSMIGNLTVLGDITISATTLNTSTYTMSVQGNWTNEGALAGTGTISFTGTTDQTITNSSGEVFYNMTTSKSSGYLIMNNNVTVSNTLNMTNGQINANLQVLTIGTSTSAVGTLSYSGGFVYNGFLSRWVNATGVAVLFPMGIQYGSYYAPLTITFNNLTAGALMVRFPPIPGTTNNGLPLVDAGTTVYNTFGQGFYSLTPLNGLASTSYNAQAVGLPFYNYYASTRILARPNSSSNWVANGTHQAGVPGTGPAKRINMTMLPADLTLADTVNCTAPVTASFTGPRSVCTNSTQTYSVTNTGNTFLWIVQGGTQMSGGNSNSITVKWGNSGTTGVLIVIEQSACGSGIPAYDFVTISPTTITSITGKSYAPENTTAGNEETYSIDPQPGYTYSWSITGGTIITGASTETITVRWGSAGTGQVSASITNSCGTSTIVKPVSIYVVINSIKSGAWDDAATWDCNCVPASYNSVRVRNPHVVTFPNSDIVINNLIADIGGRFNNTTTKTLTVNQDLLIDGSYTGTNELILNGTGTIDGVGTISTTGNLTLTGGDKTILSSCVLTRSSGDIIIKSGVNVLNNGVFTTTRNIVGETASSTWTNMDGSALNISGVFLATGTAVVNTVPNTVEYRGSGSQTIKQTNYYNLSSSSTGARVLPSSGVVGVAGDFTPGTNTYTITGSTVNFNGTDQNIGAFTFNNLSVSGGGTKTLTGAVTYNGVLNLTNGIISTGSNTLTGASTSSVTRTSGHVNGNYKKWVANTSAITFEVGTATDYTPLITTFASVSTAGYITGSAIAGDHPSIASTCLDPGKSVNVYYSLTNNTLTAGTFTLGFNYLSGDVDAAATPSKFNVEVYDGTTWSAPLTLIGTPTATQAVVSGVSTFGAYEIAEGGLVITSHPGNSSICAGNNTTFSVSTNGVSPTFQWQVNSAGTWSDISNGGVYSNATTASLTITNPAVSMNAYQYRAKVTGTQCAGVTIISNAATLTVTAAPTAVAGTAVATCSNPGTVNITAGSSSLNNNGTAWTSNGTGIFANANSLTTATYTPSAADITAGSIILTLTATGNGACATVTSNKILTITAAPTAVAGTAIATCSSTGALNITAGSSSTNNNGTNWTSNGTGTFTNPTSLTTAMYTPSAADITTGSITLTLTVTGVGTCSNVTSTKNLTITAAPTAIAGTAVSTCSSSGAVNITAGSSSTNNNGTNWTSNGTGTFTNPTSLTTATYTPSAADISSGSITLTLTATANGTCTNAASTKTLTITAPPTAVAGTALSTCSSSGAVNITAGSGSTNNNGIIWTSNGSGTFANANSLSLATYTPSGADITAGSITLTLTATANGTCSNAISTKILTITAAPTALAGNAVTACANTGAINITSGSASTNNNGITWTSSGSGTFTNANSLTLATYTPSASDNISGGVVLTLTAAGNGACSAVTSTKTFTINNACAITWTGGTSTDWNTASNWSIGAVPANTNTVTIPSGTTFSPLVSGTTASVASITINTSATLSINATGELDVYGNITNNGTLATVPGAVVAFKGNTAQSITGVAVLHKVIIDNSAGVNIQSALGVNGTLMLTRGVLTSNSNLTINFDNGGNIGYSPSDLGSISGTVTGKRDFVVAKTHYIGAPFSGVTTAQVAATTPLYVSPYWKMFTRTFATQSWAAVTSMATSMPLGTGFSLSLPAAAPLILSGTYNHTFTFTGPSYANTSTGKYLFIANPYPSVIDWDNAAGWTKTNVENAIYYWDAPNNRIASYVSGVGTNGATRYIPPMQAVLVGMTGTGGNSSVSVNNNARNMLQTSAFFRTGEDELIRITITDALAAENDETVIRFNSEATSSFDADMDARKILNSGLVPSVYTTGGTEMYSINSYISPDSARFIPVAVHLPADGKYILTIVNNNPDLEYILLDKQLGIEQAINKPYEFNGQQADDANRFELHLRTSAATATQKAGKSGGLHINSCAASGFHVQTQRYAGCEAEIEIMDLTGNSVDMVSAKKLETGTTFVPLDLPDGAYLIKMHVGSETFAGMIVLVKH
jgi:hypothetical protein